MKHNKYPKAFRSMCKIRAHPIIAARDFYYSHVIYEEEKALSGNSNYFSRLKDCFTIPRIRRANYGASTVMFAQQLCGINIRSFLPFQRAQEHPIAIKTEGRVTERGLGGRRSEIAQRGPYLRYQSSHSTPPPSLSTLSTRPPRPCMPRSATAPSKSSLPSRPSS